MRGTKGETMGMRIRKQRMLLGMTQEELAEKLCIPKTTLSAYENDKIDFKASRLTELARALSTTPNYLLGFENGMKGGTNQMDDTIIARLGNIKDEKVRKMLLAQIYVVSQMEE